MVTIFKNYRLNHRYLSIESLESLERITPPQIDLRNVSNNY